MVFKWMPPKNPPEEITEDEFTEYLSTEAGRKYLEAYRTSKGVGIGTYEELVKHPYEVWKKQQRVKYAAYYESSISCIARFPTFVRMAETCLGSFKYETPTCTTAGTMATSFE